MPSSRIGRPEQPCEGTVAIGLVQTTHDGRQMCHVAPTCFCENFQRARPLVFNAGGGHSADHNAARRLSPEGLDHLNLRQPAPKLHLEIDCQTVTGWAERAHLISVSVPSVSSSYTPVVLDGGSKDHNSLTLTLLNNLTLDALTPQSRDAEFTLYYVG